MTKHLFRFGLVAVIVLVATFAIQINAQQVVVSNQSQLAGPRPQTEAQPWGPTFMQRHDTWGWELYKQWYNGEEDVRFYIKPADNWNPNHVPMIAAIQIDRGNGLETITMIQDPTDPRPGCLTTPVIDMPTGWRFGDVHCVAQIYDEFGWPIFTGSVLARP